MKQKIKMKKVTVWVSPYTKHGFTGFELNQNFDDKFNYLERIDIINTYNLKRPLFEAGKIELIGVRTLNEKDLYLDNRSLSSGQNYCLKLLYDRLAKQSCSDRWGQNKRSL